MPKELPLLTTDLHSCDPRDVARAVMLGASLEEYQDALKDLYEAAHRNEPHSVERLCVVYSYLFQPKGYTVAEVKRAQKRAGYPIKVKHGLILYAKMDQLASVCLPRDGRVGPSCYVEPLDRDQLRLLSPEQRKLARRVENVFARDFKGRKKLTLQNLAGEILTDEGERGYSARNVRRVVSDVAGYSFQNKDTRRDHMIATVNAFGVVARADAGAPSAQLAIDDFFASVAIAISGIGQTLASLKYSPAIVNAIALLSENAGQVAAQKIYKAHLAAVANSQQFRKTIEHAERARREFYDQVEQQREFAAKIRQLGVSKRPKQLKG